QQEREMSAQEHEQSPRQNAANVRDNRETGNGDQSRQILGRQDELHGFERHHPQRIELLGNLHGPDLSRKCRTRPAADGDGRQQRAEFTGKTYRDEIYDIMQRPKTAEFRGPLHGEDEPGANRHQGNHRQGFDADLQHLAQSRLPPVSVSHQWQAGPHGAQRGPKLNIQTPHIFKLSEGPSSGAFEYICHQDTFNAEEADLPPLVSNRANKPVTSNRCSGRPCSPFKRKTVWRLRASLSPSTRVARPETSM